MQKNIYRTKNYTSLKILLFFTISCSFLTLKISAQVQQDTTRANQYLSIGDSLFQAGDFQGAIEVLKKAIPVYKNTLLWDNYVKSANKLSRSYQESGDLVKAIKEARKVIAIIEQASFSHSLASAKTFELMGQYSEKERDYKAALKFHQRALDIKKTVVPDSIKEIADSHLKISNYQYLLDDINGFIFSTKEARKLFEQISTKPSRYHALFTGNIGEGHRILGNYKLAIQYFNESINYIDKHLKEDKVAQVGKALFYNNIGTVYDARGDHEFALKYYKIALNSRLEILGKDHPRVGDSYNNIGNVFRIQGRFSEAVEYYKRDQQIIIQSSGKYHDQLAESYNNMAISYAEMGQHQKAIDFYNKAMEIHDLDQVENTPEKGAVYLNLGLVYTYKKEYDQALKFYTRGIDMLEASSKKDYNFLANGLHDIGRFYTSKGDFWNAEKYYQKEIQVLTTHFGEYHPSIANAYNAIASINSKKGLYNKSINNLKKALISNVIHHNTSERELSSTYFDPNHLFSTFSQMARAYSETFKVSGATSDLTNSLDYYLKSDSVIISFRQSLNKYSDILSFAQQTMSTYEKAISTCLTLYEVTKDKKYLNLSFYFSEQNKAGMLKTALTDISAKKISRIPDDILELERSLKFDRSFYQSEVKMYASEKVNQETTDKEDFVAKLFSTNRRFDSLTKALEKHYPEYYKLKYNNAVITVEALQNRLPKDAAFIEFFFGDSMIFIFTATKNIFEVSQVSRATFSDVKLEQLRNVLLNKMEDDTAYLQYVEAASSLYGIILNNALTRVNNIKKLIIVPDGELGYIPFGILLTGKPESVANSYNNLPYLINDFQISYGHSGTLLFSDLREYNQTREVQEYIAFAPDYDSEMKDATLTSTPGQFRERVTPLLWNKSEAQNIGKYLSGKTYSGTEALEEVFKKEAQKYSIVHLAMHALVDDENPMNSKLIFTPGADSIEDGLLHAYELYNMELDSDLAILSACNTGFGKLARGEGVMSLARAFSYAGCPSIVMSHWPVDDESTSQLMEFFYKNLSEGLSKDEALRQAKLSYLETAEPDKMHPKYWASFVVLGDTSPIVNENPYLWEWIIIGSLIVIALVFGVIRYRKTTAV